MSTTPKTVGFTGAPTLPMRTQDETAREPSLLKEIISDREHRRGCWLLVLATILLIVAVVLLWDTWPRLQAWEAALGIIGFAGSVFSLFYSLVGAIKADKAQKTAQRVQDDLVRMGLLVDRVQSYQQAFKLHVSDLLRAEPHSIYGELKEIRFLISTPAYGYHVLGSEHLGTFREGLLNTRRIPTQIILFSPDRHWDHVVNTLMWQNTLIPPNLNGESGNPLKRSEGKALASETFRILTQLWTYSKHNEESKLEDRMYDTWASHGGNVRLAYYGFTINPQAFLVLSDRVGFSTDLLHYSARVIPLHRQLIFDTATSTESYFDQFKACPYSGQKGGEASLRLGEEFVALAGDYVWLRTRFLVYTYSAFRQELQRFFQAVALSDSGAETARRDAVIEAINRFVDYFAFLQAPGSGLAVSADQEQVGVVDAVSNLVKNGSVIDNASAKEVFASLKPRAKGLVLDGALSIDRLLERNPNENCYLLLFLLASSGYGLSTFAEMRTDGQTP